MEWQRVKFPRTKSDCCGSVRAWRHGLITSTLFTDLSKPVLNFIFEVESQCFRLYSMFRCKWSWYWSLLIDQDRRSAHLDPCHVIVKCVFKRIVRYEWETIRKLSNYLIMLLNILFSLWSLTPMFLWLISGVKNTVMGTEEYLDITDTMLRRGHLRRKTKEWPSGLGWLQTKRSGGNFLF